MVTGFYAYLWRNYSPRLNRCYTSNLKSGEQRSIHQVGELGEAIARDFVRGEKRKILYKNYDCARGGEIDIVARDGEVLCFIEVKTRTSKSVVSRPMDAVDAKKRRNIIKAAKSWCSLLKSTNFLWRYDIIEVILLEGELPEIVWVKEAFTESEN